MSDSAEEPINIDAKPRSAIQVKPKPWSVGKIVAIVVGVVLVIFLLLAALIFWLVWSGKLASFLPTPKRDRAIMNVEIPGAASEEIDLMMFGVQSRIQSLSDIELVVTHSHPGKGMITVYSRFGRQFSEANLNELRLTVEEHQHNLPQEVQWSSPTRVRSTIPAGLILLERAKNDLGDSDEPVQYLRSLETLASEIENLDGVRCANSHSTALDVVIQLHKERLNESAISVHQIKQRILEDMTPGVDQPDLVAKLKNLSLTGDQPGKQPSGQDSAVQLREISGIEREIANSCFQADGTAFDVISVYLDKVSTEQQRRLIDQTAFKLANESGIKTARLVWLDQDFNRATRSAVLFKAKSLDSEYLADVTRATLAEINRSFPNVRAVAFPNQSAQILEFKIVLFSDNGEPVDQQAIARVPFCVPGSRRVSITPVDLRLQNRQLVEVAPLEYMLIGEADAHRVDWWINEVTEELKKDPRIDFVSTIDACLTHPSIQINCNDQRLAELGLDESFVQDYVDSQTRSTQRLSGFRVPRVDRVDLVLKIDVGPLEYGNLMIPTADEFVPLSDVASIQERSEPQLQRVGGKCAAKLAIWTDEDSDRREVTKLVLNACQIVANRNRHSDEVFELIVINP